QLQLQARLVAPSFINHCAKPRRERGRELPCPPRPGFVFIASRPVVMRKLRTLVVISLLIFCGAASARAQAKLLAGTGKADITPPIGTPLAGYGGRLGRPSTGVHDPTEARALIIDNGAEKIAFVSVD